MDLKENSATVVKENSASKLADRNRMDRLAGRMDGLKRHPAGSARRLNGLKEIRLAG